MLATRFILAAGFCLVVFGCNSSIDSGGGASGTLSFTLGDSVYTVSGKHLGAGGQKFGAYAYYESHYKELDIYGTFETPYRGVILSTSGLSDTATLNIGGLASGTSQTTTPATLLYKDSLTLNHGRRFSSSFTAVTTFKGTMTLTKFGTSGGSVSGTFSGKLSQIYPDGAVDSVTITDGSFTNLPVE